MRYVIILTLALGCMNESHNQNDDSNLVNTESKINHLIDQWHKDAAEVKLNDYLNFMDTNCYYVGTDATEIWSKNEFRSFCQPYFKDNKTWDFTPLTRTISINKSGNVAWFYETLDTHMGTCRGSGVISFKDSKWKLKQYVLSLAIPNSTMNKVKEIIHDEDSLFQESLKK